MKQTAITVNNSGAQAMPQQPNLLHIAFCPQGDDRTAAGVLCNLATGGVRSNRMG